jgi:hypothetical protein
MKRAGNWSFSLTVTGFLSLLLLLSSLLFAQTQTDTVNAGTNTPADASVPATNSAPAYFAPTPAQPPANAAAQSQANGSLQAGLDDIRPPFFFLYSWSWLWVALGIAAALALLVALLIWLWPRRQLSPKTAYELTLEKLEKAHALLREDEPMPYAVLVSETIRSYLGQRFQSPSTRRTTEEFLRIMEIDPTSHLADHRDLLRGFLQSCDLVKFARYQPTITELEQVHQTAYRFVTATKPESVSSHRNGK